MKEKVLHFLFYMLMVKIRSSPLCLGSPVGTQINIDLHLCVGSLYLYTTINTRAVVSILLQLPGVLIKVWLCMRSTAAGELQTRIFESEDVRQSFKS